MTQDRLARALFPLGALSKAETRKLAEEWRLPVANKPESQDICFVPYKRYTEFLERHAPGDAPGGPDRGHQRRSASGRTRASRCTPSGSGAGSGWRWSSRAT